jgi:hypothetical protein
MISSQRLPKPSNGRMEVSNPLQQEGLSVDSFENLRIVHSYKVIEEYHTCELKVILT